MFAINQDVFLRCYLFFDWRCIPSVNTLSYSFIIVDASPEEGLNSIDNVSSVYEQVQATAAAATCKGVQQQYQPSVAAALRSILCCDFLSLGLTTTEDRHADESILEVVGLSLCHDCFCISFQVTGSKCILLTACSVNSYEDLTFIVGKPIFIANFFDSSNNRIVAVKPTDAVVQKPVNTSAAFPLHQPDVATSVCIHRPYFNSVGCSAFVFICL